MSGNLIQANAIRLGRTGVGLDLSSEYLWDIAKGKVEAPMQREMF